MPHGLSLRVKSLSLTLAMLGTACLVPGPAVAGSQSGEVHTRNQSAAPATESDVMAFRRLRTEGIAAATADDLDLAAALLAQADGRIPNHPGLMALQARVDAARGNGAGAISHLQRYARAGFIMNLERDAALSPLSDMPGFAQAADRIAANALPIGADRLSILASVPGAGLIEGVVRDEAGEGWLVSRVAGRDILRLRGTEFTTFVGATPSIEGLLGLALDTDTGILWAASSPAPPAVHARQGPTGPAALLQIGLDDGRVRAVYPVPDEPGLEAREHGLGDVAVHPDGTVYVSDGLAGEVYRLAPSGAALETLVASGTLGSPQGLVVTPDGTALVIADYSSGLWRVALGGGVPSRMVVPADAGLIGIDGLITDGQAIYALQNGTAPQRVLRLVPDADWTRIDTVEVLAANLPQIAEPTTGLVAGGELVFVSRSQWSDFAADGSLRTPEPAPGIIARLRLD